VTSRYFDLGKPFDSIKFNIVYIGASPNGTQCVILDETILRKWSDNDERVQG